MDSVMADSIKELTVLAELTSDGQDETERHEAQEIDNDIIAEGSGLQEPGTGDCEKRPFQRSEPCGDTDVPPVSGTVPDRSIRLGTKGVKDRGLIVGP